MIEIVRKFARQIKNGRTLQTIIDHMKGEVIECQDEIDLVLAGQPEGEDGIVGEAIDIIQCALDLIFEVRPDITAEELDAIMLRKCEKWLRYYANSIEKAG
jgi:hypothetical protein